MNEPYLSDHIRITILRLLLKLPGYRANDSVLTDGVRMRAMTVPRDRVRTEIYWLAEQGLVSAAPLEKLVIATLTQRGQDVAEGHATVPGVKRPSAG